MALIRSEVDVHADAQKVWGIISDIDGELEFWNGTKEIRNISNDGGLITREVTIAFRDKKCIQEVRLHPPEKVVAKFTDGIILGTKTVSVRPTENGCTLEAIWDIRLAGMMGLFTGMLKKHVKDGTEKALCAIRDKAES